MIAWLKSKKKLVAENEALQRSLTEALAAAATLTSQIEHAGLLADRVRSHVALGCPESYGRMKRELAAYDKRFRKNRERE